jgi:hypothetical protein
MDARITFDPFGNLVWNGLGNPFSGHRIPMIED